jgi:hypothetical protein
LTPTTVVPVPSGWRTPKMLESDNHPPLSVIVIVVDHGEPGGPVNATVCCNPELKAVPTDVKTSVDGATDRVLPPLLVPTPLTVRLTCMVTVSPTESVTRIVPVVPVVNASRAAPLTETVSPSLMFVVTEFACSHPLLLVAAAVKVKAPAELTSVTCCEAGNTPVPDVKLMLIVLVEAVNAPVPPAVTVNVTGITVAVPPLTVGVTVILPLYVPFTRLSPFAATVSVAGAVLDTLVELADDRFSHVWSNVSVKPIGVALAVERATDVEVELLESDTLGGFAAIVPVWPPPLDPPLVKFTVKVIGRTPDGAVADSRTTAEKTPEAVPRFAGVTNTNPGVGLTTSTLNQAVPGVVPVGPPGGTITLSIDAVNVIGADGSPEPVTGTLRPPVLRIV